MNIMYQLCIISEKAITMAFTYSLNTCTEEELAKTAKEEFGETPALQLVP